MAREVAYRDNFTSKENLPLPNVYYPSHYGTFFQFSNDKSKIPYFCSCSKEAFENYLKLYIKKYDIFSSRSLSDRDMILNLRLNKIFKDLLLDRKTKYNDIHNAVNYKHQICHECNNSTPKYAYCADIYGSKFEQYYGWYINKKQFEYGFIKSCHFSAFYQYFCELVPLDILKLLKEVNSLAKNNFIFYNKWINHEHISKEMINQKAKDSKRFLKLNRTIRNIVENEVRIKFNHKKIGEFWTSETILFYIIESLFKGKTIHRHFRPDFLKGLELDIFIEELRLGIEYQGIQHFQPVKHWGGKEALNNLIKRDRLKSEICKENNINLVYFNYDEPLDEDIVQNKMTPFFP